MTKDAKGYIFYEAKFRKEPVSAEMIRAEISQVEETGFCCYKYGFLSRSGFTAKQEENLILITLEEMYDGTQAGEPAMIVADSWTGECEKGEVGEQEGSN